MSARCGTVRRSLVLLCLLLLVLARTAHTMRRYSFTLKGLVLANSHAYLDSQLAAIYHSSLNVFACFPPDRPDLPVSYFSRFLFSDK